MIDQRRSCRFQAVATLGLLLALCSSICGHPDGCPAFPSEAIVTVWSRTGPGGQSLDHEGTGFLISPDGYILTNAHVVSETAAVMVRTYTGEIMPAEVMELGFGPANSGEDFALLKVDAEERTHFVLGDSSGIQVGDAVWIAGYPGLLMPESVDDIGSPTVTRGGINRLDTSVSLRFLGQNHTYDGLIQVDAVVKPGSSGSPVLNAEGEVVAVVVGGSSQATRPFYFCIPIAVALDSLSLKEVLPGYAPQITFVQFPDKVDADGELRVGKAQFRDLNGDLYMARFEILGQQVEAAPPFEPLDTVLFVQVFPELRGETEGEFSFAIGTPIPQKVSATLTLVDEGRHRSTPYLFSFEAVDPWTAPEVVSVSLPLDGGNSTSTISADGEEWIGLVRFRDADLDVERAIIRVDEEVENLTIRLGDQTQEDQRTFDFHLHTQREEVDSFVFYVSTDVAQEIGMSLVLVDKRDRISSEMPIAVAATSHFALDLLPSTLTFRAEAGGPAPPTQALTIANLGEAASWHTEVDVPWLTVTPSTGLLASRSEDELVLTVHSDGLGIGDYRGTITVTAVDAPSVQQHVAIDLAVTPASPSRFLIGPYDDTECGAAASDSPIAYGTFSWLGPGPVLSCVHDAVDAESRGNVFRLDYDVGDPDNFSGLWLQWRASADPFDPESYGEVSVWMRASGVTNSVGGVKLELKVAGWGWRTAYVEGITNEWQEFRLPLDNFTPWGVWYSDPERPNEFVVTIENSVVTANQGTLWIDEVTFLRASP